jgi:hypothetical protein
MQILILFLILAGQTLLFGNTGSAIGCFSAVNNDQRVEISVQSDDFTLRPVQAEGRDYVVVDAPLGAYPASEGAPTLPYYATLIQIPATGAVQVRVDGYDEEFIPSATPLPIRIPEADPADIVPPYDTRGVQPIAEIGDPAIMRDLRVVPLRVYPFVYDESRGGIIHRRNLRVTVESIGGAGINELQPTRRLSSRSFETLYRGLVANYQRDEADPCQQRSILMICPNNAAINDLAAQLVEWKRSKGFAITKVTLSQTGTGCNAIKTYIQNAYDTWENPPEYIVLVGDAVGSISVPTFNESVSGYNGETDHPYTCLAGGDLYPEVFVGRLSAASSIDMQTIWAKIGNYEIQPFMNDTSWYNRNLLISDTSSSGVSTYFTNMFVREMIESAYPSASFTELTGAPTASAVNNAIESGVVLMSYRGIGGLNGWEVQDINQLTNGFRLPSAVINTCNTGSFATGTSRTEAWLRAGTPSQPQAGISAIGMSTNGTHTAFNNCLTYGIYYGLYGEGMNTMGEALMAGKINLIANFQGTATWDIATHFIYWCNLMGDPSLDVWKTLPKTIVATFPNSIPAGTSSIDVSCADTGGNPIADTWVTLRQADGTETFFVTGYTNAQGAIRLSIDPELTGDLDFTATKPGYIPNRQTVAISAAGILGLDSTVFDDTEGGNGDGQPNPGETVGIVLHIVNHGGATATGISVDLGSTDEYVTSWVSHTASLPDCQPGTEVVNDSPLRFTLSPATPDRRQIWFDASFTTDQGPTTIHFPVIIPGVDIDVEALVVNDGDNQALDPGESAPLELRLANHGQTPVSDIQARIIIPGGLISLSDSLVTFGSLTPGQDFTCTADTFTVESLPTLAPGMQIPCTIQLWNASGYAETETFILTIGQADVNDPLGPDAYGYYCYDDGDIGYLDCPVYDWIELNPTMTPDFPGTALSLTDAGDNHDALITIDLPFTFSYYGVDYSSMQVCTNGFVTFMDTDNADLRNGRLPGPGGPSAMIAPFWDDLKTNSSSKILEYYDASQHRFIIEWSKMRSFYDNSEETFELILLDPAFNPTTLGDGKIQIQYLTFNNVDLGSANPEAPEQGNYCTIGIEDPTATIGLEYSWNDTYPTPASPLGNGRAILFSGPPVLLSEAHLGMGQILVDGQPTTGVNHGAQVQCAIRISNTGTLDATGVHAVITTNSPYVTILNGQVDCGQIDAGEFHDATFQIDLSPYCSDQAALSFTLSLTSDQDNREYVFALQGIAPEFTATGFDTGEFAPSPGDQLAPTFSMTNSGHGVANDVRVSMWCDDPFITIDESETTIAQFNVAQSINLLDVFHLSISENSPTVHLFRLNILVSEPEGPYAVFQYEVTTGFGDNMETGAPGWTHYTLNDTEDSWNLSNQRSHSASHAWKMGSTSTNINYSNNLLCALESPEFELPENVYLAFYQWLDAEVSNSDPGYCFDGGLVQILQNDQWVAITPVGGYPMLTTVGVNPPFDANTGVFSGQIDWAQALFDLSGYSGATKFRFLFGSDNAYRREGWYIDDVRLTDSPANLLPPIDLASEVNPQQQVRLTWSAPDAPVTGYKVYRRAGDAPSYSMIAQTTDCAYLDVAPSDSTLFYAVTAIYANGESAYSNLVEAFVTTVGTHASTVPAYTDALLANYPNPFNPETRLRYSLKQDARVTLAAYNLRGERIRTVLDGRQSAGAHEATWNGRDDNGRPVSSGVYFLRMTANGKTVGIRKALLLK